MIKYFDPITAKQLQSCAEDVLKQKNYYFLIEMFSCKLKFVIDICKKWVGEKYLKNTRFWTCVVKKNGKKNNLIDLTTQSV